MDVPELTAVIFAKRASVRRRVENPRRNHTALLGFRVVQGPGTIDIVGLGPWISLTRLNWTPFGANDWEFSMAMSYVTQILLNLMEINWILKIFVFGLGRFTNDVINLKHQGACQKLMIG